MYVLVMGYRLGIARALEKRGVSYLVWSEKPILNKLKAEFIICDNYPHIKQDLLTHKNELAGVTHIIAGTESSVFAAAQCRFWLKTRRNKKSAFRRCTDKLLMKRYLRECGVPMTAFASGYTRDKAPETFESIGGDIIAKPRKSSGGFGQKRMNLQSIEDLPEDSHLIFEKKIRGQEGSIESFIEDGKIIFENQTRYVDVGRYSLLPTNYEKYMAEEISKLNHKVITDLDIQWGMTHLEYDLTESGVLFGEVALRPPGGYLMELIKLAYGVDIWDLFVGLELGEESMERHLKKPKGFAACVMYTPSSGEGILSQEDEVSIKETPHLKKFKLKVQPGEVIPERERTGQDWGYAILHSMEYDSLKSAADQLSPLLK